MKSANAKDRAGDVSFLWASHLKTSLALDMEDNVEYRQTLPAIDRLFWERPSFKKRPGDFGIKKWKDATCRLSKLT